MSQTPIGLLIKILMSIVLAGERGFEPQIMFKGSPLFGEEPEPIVIGSA